MAGSSTTPGFRSVSAATKVTPLTLKHAVSEVPSRVRPFVTISREGGAGGRTIGSRLVDRLNELDPGEPPWSLWDKGLVEKVANEHHISQEAIEALESSHKPWMQEFLAGLSMQADPADVRIYRMVGTAIRALAAQGRVVVVGRGGAFITRNMPGGVHLRLVAPTEFRIDAMARQLNIAREAAAEHVRQLDHQRAAFYKRFWPKNTFTPDAFTLTINTANADEQRAVECILPLVLADSRVTVHHPSESLGTGV